MKNNLNFKLVNGWQVQGIIFKGSMLTAGLLPTSGRYVSAPSTRASIQECVLNFNQVFKSNWSQGVCNTCVKVTICWCAFSNGEEYKHGLTW